VGDAEHDPSSDVVAQVANEVYGQDLLSLLVTHLGQFDFEVSQLSNSVPTQLIDRRAKIPPQSTVRYCVERLDLDHLLLNS
jgi:calcium binding protein 39